jgi:uncharacterized protein (TIGR03118 family)
MGDGGTSAAPILVKAPFVLSSFRKLKEVSMRNWLRRWHRRLAVRPASRRLEPCRLFVEPLEARRVLAGNVLQTNLVSDLPGVAQHLDPNLVNPWGISESAGSPFWISDNNAGVSTLYNTAGAPQALVVRIPAPGDPLGASGTPTGTVFNIDGGSTGGFQLTGVSKTGAPISASAAFLFVTEDGTIVGWNPGVNPAGFDPTKAGTYGIIAVDNSANPTAANGAVYKGLTIATGPNGPIFASDPNSATVLYASNFRAGTVEVYDTNFKPVTLPTGAFTDPNLPKGYAPFNVQVLGGKVYVTYAKQDDAKHDDVSGPHHGFVDMFNLDGSGETRLISGGPLDSPWGLAIAPSSFGSLGGALLVGNFGDGHINAFNAATGAFLGELKDPDGEPIQIDGLWALKVGNGTASGGDADKVYFTAGLFGETHGLFGSLAPVAAGTAEGPAEAQAVTAAVDVFLIDLNTLQTDLAAGASRATIRQDIQTLNSALVDVIHAEVRFAADARDDLGTSANKGRDHDDVDDLFADLGSLLRDRY